MNGRSGRSLIKQLKNGNQGNGDIKALIGPNKQPLMQLLPSDNLREEELLPEDNHQIKSPESQKIVKKGSEKQKDDKKGLELIKIEKDSVKENNEKSQEIVIFPQSNFSDSYYSQINIKNDPKENPKDVKNEKNDFNNPENWSINPANFNDTFLFSGNKKFQNGGNANK